MLKKYTSNQLQNILHTSKWNLSKTIIDELQIRKELKRKNELTNTGKQVKSFLLL